MKNKSLFITVILAIITFCASVALFHTVENWSSLVFTGCIAIPSAVFIISLAFLGDKDFRNITPAMCILSLAYLVGGITASYKYDFVPADKTKLVVTTTGEIYPDIAQPTERMVRIEEGTYKTISGFNGIASYDIYPEGSKVVRSGTANTQVKVAFEWPLAYVAKHVDVNYAKETDKYIAPFLSENIDRATLTQKVCEAMKADGYETCPLFINKIEVFEQN